MYLVKAYKGKMKYQEKFIAYLKYEKRYSSHTVLAYKKDLEQYFKFYSSFSDNKDCSLIQTKDVRAWVVYLMDLNLKAKSIRRKLSSLNTYYHYLNKKEITNHNPVSLVVLPKLEKRLPHFVEEKQMNFLLDEIDFPNNFEGKRDALIINLFYQTGIRLSELINLKIEDVDLVDFKIKVLGKRNKERIIPLNENIINSIKVYLKEKETLKLDVVYFFVTEKNKKMYPKLVYNIVNKYIAMVSTIEKKSPHVLRHTFATHMLNNGADLMAIKDLLGHSSLAATQIYTHNSFDKLKSAYQKAHPRK